MLTTTLFAATLLAAQFVEGAPVTSQGCTSFPSGANNTIVISSVGTFKNTATQQPKQGETFFVYLNVSALPQPCASHLVVRPGFKLPPGIEFVPPPAQGGFGAPVARCLMGAGSSGTAQPCMLLPTEVLADGTLMFDAPPSVNGGLWRIPDGQTLQIQIPVRGDVQQATQVQGFVDFAAFDFIRPALRPTVGVDVFFNPPSVAYPTPAVSAVGSYGAHVFGHVDPHFNAGVLALELARAGEALVSVDNTVLDASLFEADVDLALQGLDPDTDYEFRWTYTAFGREPVRGAVQTFRTLPAPRFPVVTTVQGEGTVTASVALNSDGTLFDRTQVTFTARPADGHRLVSLLVNGDPVPGSLAVVTVAGPVAVDALFEALPVAPTPAPPATDEPAEEPAAEEPAAEQPADEVEAPAEQPADEVEAPAAEQPAAEDDASDIRVRAPSDRDDAAASDEASDEEAGGCASTKPAAVPLMFAALLFWRRRR